MSASLSITSAVTDPGLLDLPWHEPLDVWPDDAIATMRVCAALADSARKETVVSL